ncbi:MAG: Rpn family recombination-promoting nuclease/putative transposase [Proteobacteria bacterium]|nr:Rpn family recombination-promoting nuclease/putative transposase [Pseudomonadota bacterium]
MRPRWPVHKSETSRFKNSSESATEQSHLHDTLLSRPADIRRVRAQEVSVPQLITRLTHDVVFKFVFGSKGSEEPLRALLNALLERRPGERIEQVEIMNPGLGGAHLDDKHIILDVRARDERRGAYNIEVQVASERHFEKRATYYLTKIHAEQLHDGETITCGFRRGKACTASTC